jgi:hypothetical protein
VRYFGRTTDFDRFTETFNGASTGAFCRRAGVTLSLRIGSARQLCRKHGAACRGGIRGKRHPAFGYQGNQQEVQAVGSAGNFGLLRYIL